MGCENRASADTPDRKRRALKMPNALAKSLVACPVIDREIDV